MRAQMIGYPAWINHSRKDMRCHADIVAIQRWPIESSQIEIRSSADDRVLGAYGYKVFGRFAIPAISILTIGDRINKAAPVVHKASLAIVIHFHTARGKTCARSTTSALLVVNKNIRGQGFRQGKTQSGANDNADTEHKPEHFPSHYRSSFINLKITTPDASKRSLRIGTCQAIS